MYHTVDDKLGNYSHTLQSIDDAIEKASHACPGLFVKSCTYSHGATACANISVVAMAQGIKARANDDLYPKIENVLDVLPYTWRIAEAIAGLLILLSFSHNLMWYRKIALEVQQEGTTSRHFGRYGVDWPEFTQTIAPHLSPSMASQYVGQVFWNTFLCAYVSFVFFLLVLTVISDKDYWYLVRDYFGHNTGDRILGLFYTFLGALIVNVAVQIVLDKWCTRVTRRFGTDHLAKIHIIRPALFSILYPVAMLFNFPFSLIFAVKRVFLYLWITFKTISRSDRTLVREGGFNLDNMFMSFLATIEMYHNNGSHLY
jgi:hypothetical protein